MLAPRLILDWTLYRLALLLAAPLIPLRLLWRGRRERGYLEHWGERMGGAEIQPGAIWIHAVSVGEMRAAQPLIEAVRTKYPDKPILLTCMTPAGRATAEALYGGFARIVYLPYDYAILVRRFLRRARPAAGILMETELWPNLIRAAACEGVPMMLANARLSARSARGYARLRALTQASLARVPTVAAQTGADAMRLTELGAREVQVTGNLKFDITPSPALIERGSAWRRQWGARPVWLAASTREGEEALLLHAFADMAPATVLLVLVPRHPQRFDAVADLIEATGLSYVRRSTNTPPAVETRVLLGDSLGELFAYYTACDVAFVGGSLLPLGGQNLIEAASVGKPILVGPHTFNFDEATRQAIEAGAAVRVPDARACVKQATALLADAPARARMSEAGRTFVRRHRGAAARTTALLATLIAPAGQTGSP